MHRAGQRPPPETKQKNIFLAEPQAGLCPIFFLFDAFLLLSYRLELVSEQLYEPEVRLSACPSLWSTLNSNYQMDCDEMWLRYSRSPQDELC